MKGNRAMRAPIRRMAAIFLAPALLFYVCLFIYPSLKAFYISFFDWDGFSGNMDFIGLANFKELFGDSSFWSIAVKNSFLITFVGGVLIFGIAFLLSAVLSSKLRGKKFFRALIFFPSVINPIAVAILWTIHLQRQMGLAEQLSGLAGH